MIKKYIEKVLSKESLTFDEARDALNRIMSGEVNNSQLAGLLIALKAKGEESDEIAGFAAGMRQNMIKISIDSPDAIDVCGTGGDESGTFNISTAASFVVAGAGVTVAKHGNRSISSKSGSADVLLELGVPIDLTPNQSETLLNTVGIAFLFAPIYHPAMKYAGAVRKELGMKTIFNLLGPLTNPAGVKQQVTGVFNDRAAKKMADSAHKLGFERAIFLCSGNKYDEVILSQSCYIFSYDRSETSQNISNYKLNAKDFGFSAKSSGTLSGNSPKENAARIFSILSGEDTTIGYQTVVANAAMGISIARKNNNLLECVSLAEDSIKSGKALEKLRKSVING